MLAGALVRRAREVRDLGGAGPWGFLDGSIPPPDWDGIGGAAGVPVNESTAMRASAVYASTNLIANGIATLPTGAFHTEVRDGRDVPIRDEKPRLLAEPHPEMDVVDWWSRICMSLLLRGNGYGLITRVSREAWPEEILPLHPDQCQPRRNRSTGEIEYRVRGLKEPQLAWPRGPVWHVRGTTLPGAVEGISPIEAARQNIGLALAAEEFGARFFGDAAMPSGVLKVKDDFKDNPADQARARRILVDWERSHGRRRRPALLTNGAEWEAISINPNEAQFLETRRFQLGDIARIFGVPPHMIGDVEKSTSWGTGIEQQGIGFVTYTLRPWIVRLEHATNQLLPDGQYMKFNVAGLLRGDLKSRYEAYAIGRQWGVITTNDILALEESPPVPGGDVRLQPLSHRDAATPSLKERVDAAGVLVRAGYDPSEVLLAVGLDPIEHTGLIPVTVQFPDPEDVAPPQQDLPTEELVPDVPSNNGTRAHV